MYMKSLQKFRCLTDEFQTGHFALSREENIVEFLEGRFVTKSFPCPQEEN